MLNVAFSYCDAQCRYAEFHYAKNQSQNRGSTTKKLTLGQQQNKCSSECHIELIMLSVIMLSVIMLSVIMLSVIMKSVIGDLKQIIDEIAIL